MPRRLKNWIRTFAEFTTHSEAPDLFNFWTGVSTIAGALRRQVYIDQLKFKWYPNFYIILVAPPGIATKSSTIGAGLPLLRQVEGIFMGPQSMTWQGLTKALSGSTKLVPLEETGDMLTTAYVPMSAITCEVSELGTFLDPKNDELTSVLIDLWDGKEGAWERWLSTQEGTRIENPWINIIAGTTPSWLRTNFTEIMIGGGLASRIIFVFADRKKALIPYINRAIKPSAYEQMKDDLIHDLQDIAKMLGPFSLTEAAYEFGSSWYEKHWTEPDEHLLGERFLGYRARKQTHIHKLAMILSAAESSSRIIERHHLELATQFVTGVEYDMHKVFESVTTNDSSKHIFDLISHLKLQEKLSRQDLWRFCMRSMGPREFEDCIKAATSAGYVRITMENGLAMFTYVGGEDDQSKSLERNRKNAL